MKKIIVAFISFFILIVVMITIVVVFRKDVTTKSANGNISSNYSLPPEEKKLKIVATLFPQYDFAKQIVGDKADVKLLLNSGVEAHNYEPTAQDMIDILDDSDIFLYTGSTLEPWTTKIIKSLEETNCSIIDISKNINLISITDFEERHLNSEIHHDEYYGHYGHHAEKHHNNHIYDGHVWLSPTNSIIMMDNILEGIINLDPDNAEYYKSNAENYKKQILEIDNEYKNLIHNCSRKEIACGGEFAYSYLIEEYGINFVSVYTNCGEGEDPSIAKVKSVIDYINHHHIPVVYYEELSEGTVAKMIAEETDAEPLVLYSIHNGDPEKDTYVSLMKKNCESLRKGLN